MNSQGNRAQFTAMEHSTPEDWAIIREQFKPLGDALPARVLAHLKLLDGDFGGFKIDRFQHSLQTATRAHRDGRDEPYVVMALLHDIGDTLGSFNHPEIAAAMLRPFVSPELHWIAQNHGAFQGHYYFHHIGMDRTVRERFRGHPSFEACATFCERYDQCAFDPEYDTAPLEFFRPMVERVMARPINAMYPPETAAAA